jgi:hypothetical protein
LFERGGGMEARQEERGGALGGGAAEKPGAPGSPRFAAKGRGPELYLKPIGFFTEALGLLIGRLKLGAGGVGLLVFDLGLVESLGFAKAQVVFELLEAIGFGREAALERDDDVFKGLELAGAGFVGFGNELDGLGVETVRFGLGEVGRHGRAADVWAGGIVHSSEPV